MEPPTSTPTTMHDDRIDLDAYLRRIALPAQALRADLATLDTLIAHHVAAIPFENLSPLLGEPVDISLAGVQKKLVGAGRGGYCYEQNRLFAEALRALGFTVHELAARVMWNQPPGVVVPRTHMLLEVELADGPRVADVGFGGLTLTSTLRLEVGTEQRTPHGPFRLLEQAGEWQLQARIGDGWRAVYHFDRGRQLPCDYIAPNYFISTHPDSIFTANLMVARAGRGRRWTLRNREYTEYHDDGRILRHTLGDLAELGEVLQTRFLLPPALCDAVLPRLARLFER